jgi:hypothetical protein
MSIMLQYQRVPIGLFNNVADVSTIMASGWLMLDYTMTYEYYKVVYDLRSV